uniref:Structural maintenance of chromosomes protein 5 n=1 Tax=Drosophila melanogaster TaxID=7227 RepID=Q8T386_DROME|nr:SMC5 protein [Drosophila melanogaster]
MAGDRALSSKQLAGRIHSVYCKDFVSYSEITFHPKHYLNVLTGPNGSGKSTIVSAIILGLGGEPILLDRSASVADYIQSNKTSATIIVRVYGRTPNTTETFRRIINSNGLSTFSVNDKDTSKKNFLAAVSSFNIQVSNLCQFLPQDRVQDFSKMNPQELLLNTMSSVCDEDLINSFNSLKQMRTEQANVHANREKEKSDLVKKQKRLEQVTKCVDEVQNFNSYLQMTVSQYKEREEVKQKLQVYSAKKLWVETQAGEAKAAEMKTQVKNAKTQSDKLKNQHDKLLQSQEQIEKEKESLRKALLEKQNIKKSRRTATECDNLNQLVENKIYELETLNKSRPLIVSELERAKESCAAARGKAMEQYSRRRQLEQKLNDEMIPEITAYKLKIERLRNVKMQKIDVSSYEIRAKNPNLVVAMNWLAQNKQRYKLNVYDPMILELTVQNHEDAKFLENVVAQRDLFAFACEDKGDMSDLINELCVKQKLGVNVIYCAPSDRLVYSPKTPIDDLRCSFGFRSYLVDLVTGPIPLINKLCASYSIHNIPIGTEAVGNYTSSIPKAIRVYFGILILNSVLCILGSKKFVVTASRYRSDTILTESSIRAKNQLITVDSQQLALVMKQCSEAVKESDSIKNAITQTDNEFERLQAVAKDEQEKRRKLDQKIAHFNSLKTEIETLQKKLEALRNSDSLDCLETNFCNSLHKDLKKIFDADAELCSCLKAIDRLIIEKNMAQTKVSIYMLQHETQIEALKESEEQSKAATRDFQQLLQCLENQISDVNKRKSAIQGLCHGEIPTSSKFPFKKEFRELENIDLPELREAIHDFQARLECMKSVNSEAISSYQGLQNEVKQLEEGIQESVNQAKSIESGMSNLYDKWEPKLNSLVETISTKFSEFMESIEYVGEVVLSKTDKDFDSYGIQIMVQFRRGLQLQPLDKFIQSGGERAVSIAIYSLSLQHVTHVPFRCVDEINQGMDATNERHIFDLLLKEATKHGSAQYLFVTPKLLRDLNYNEHLCVSIVHNSKTVCHGMQFPMA